MDKIVIKKKEYEIIKPLAADYSCDDGFLVTFEGEKYLLVKMNDEESVSRKVRFNELLKIYKDLKHSSIPVPKLISKDKKNSIYVRELVEGETVLDYLINKDLPDSFYEKIFDYAYFARAMNKLINFFPTNFVIKDDKLIYTKYQIRTYKKEDALEWNAIRYWLYTPELVDYLKANDLPYDKSRLDAPNAINKKVVLLVCKYRK